MFQGRKQILLGIDLEEFDIPEEFGQKIDLESKIMVSKVGLQNLLPILDPYHIPVTFFTTAFWAKQQPEIVLKLAARHEIASHTYYHNSFQIEDLQLSRIALSKIAGTEVRGLRMPKMKMISPIDIQNAGYKYDSSLNPVYIPGRYNHLGAKKHVYKIDDMYEMPVSVSTPLRIPLFWLSFKNLPLSLYLSLCTRTLNDMGCLIIYFHPWEFTDLKSFKLPGYIKRLSGTKMLERINLLLKELTQQGEFVTHSRFLESLEAAGK
jgi:peptidoglycan/xylan/chitin deacetylase (PgdA/CDA1 family)